VVPGEAVGSAVYVTDTVAVDVQVPLAIVQVYTYAPYAEAVAVVEPTPAPLLNVVVPGPDVCVHVPVPNVGVLPPREVLVNPPQMFCAPPAVAAVGAVIL
jgi:hypothetical protein